MTKLLKLKLKLKRKIKKWKLIQCVKNILVGYYLNNSNNNNNSIICFFYNMYIQGLKLTLAKRQMRVKIGVGEYM